MRVHGHLKLLSQFFNGNGRQCLGNHIKGWRYFVLVESLAFLRNRRHLVLDANVLDLLFCASGPIFGRVLFAIRIPHG